MVNEYFILLVALLCWDWSCATWSSSYAMVMLAVVRLLPIPHVDVVAACSPCCWWLAGRVVLLLLLLELFFSFVSATRYKTGYDHILLGDLICMFFLVLYSPSPPVSVPDPTQALTFDPALGVALLLLLCDFLGDRWLSYRTNNFSVREYFRQTEFMFFCC